MDCSQPGAVANSTDTGGAHDLVLLAQTEEVGAEPTTAPANASELPTPPQSPEVKNPSEAFPVASDENVTEADICRSTGTPDLINNRSYFVDALKSTADYLLDPTAGFLPVQNLKEPFSGFSADNQHELFTMIDSDSNNLYNKVVSLYASQRTAVKAAVKSVNGVIKIKKSPGKPGRVLGTLCWMTFVAEPPKVPEKDPPSHPFLLNEDKKVFSERQLEQFRAVLDAGWKREVVMRSVGSKGRKKGDVYYYNPAGRKFRSSKMVEKYLKEEGDKWSIGHFTFAKVQISGDPDQEIVRRACGGRSGRSFPNNKDVGKDKETAPLKEAKPEVPEPSKSPVKTPVKGQSPEKMKSETTVAEANVQKSTPPLKRGSSNAVVRTYKRAKGQDDKSRKSTVNDLGPMQMGMLPPKYPKKMEESFHKPVDSDDLCEFTRKDEDDFKLTTAMDDTKEDSLFQISALHQSGRIEADFRSQLPDDNGFENGPLAPDFITVRKSQMIDAAINRSHLGIRRMPAPPPAIPQEYPQARRLGTSRFQHHVEVLPCSIRCPGMEGVVPGLNCVRCFCLFHPECLGLPPNLSFRNYQCPNCTNQADSSPMSVNTVSSQPRNLIQKPGPLPGLESITEESLLRGVSFGSDITVTLVPKKQSNTAPHLKAPAPTAPGRIRMPAIPTPYFKASAASQIPAVPRAYSVVPAPRKMGGRLQGSGAGSRLVPQNYGDLTITRKLGTPRTLPVSNLPHAIKYLAAPKPVPGKRLLLPKLMTSGTKTRQAIPVVPKLLKPDAFRVTVLPPYPVLSGRTFKRPPTPPRGYRPSFPLRLAPGPKLANKPAAGVSNINRPPQSLCTIGTKKFVVLPKRKPEEVKAVQMKGGSITAPPPENRPEVEIVRLDGSPVIIKKIVEVGHPPETVGEPIDDNEECQ